MTMQTLESPDVALNEEVQLLAANNRWIRVFGTSGGGGGAVTSVTGTAPITVAPSTGAVVVGIDGSYPAVADFWPFDRPIPNSAIAPELAQAQAAAGAGQPLTIRTQAAAAGSGLLGGDLQLILGKDDAFPAPRGFFFGYETAIGGLPPATNIFGMATLRANAGGVVILTLGGGTNGSGAGVAGVEISAFTGLSIATENASPINIAPGNGVTSQAEILFSTLADGQLQAQWTSVTGQPTASAGYIGLPWGNSSSAQEIIDQRDAANGNNLSIVSRQTGQLTFGSFAENSQHLAADTLTLGVLRDGTGIKLVGVDGTIAAFASDSHATESQGDIYPPTIDSRYTQLYSANTTATTANQTIASIPIPNGSEVVTVLQVTINARNAGNADFAGLELSNTFIKNAGVITAGAGAAATIDHGHSAAATGIAPQLVVSGNSVLVQVTPWTVTATNWLVRVDALVNTGVAQPPPAPPGNPLMWVRADLEALGAVTTWTDQSGHGNSPTLAGGATAPVNTAGVGPNPTLPAVVCSAGVWHALELATALIGTTNFTIAITAKTNNTGTQQAYATFGNEVLVGINNVIANTRDFRFLGVSDSTFGAGSTNWEAWVLTSDATGNLTAMVNGVPVSVTPTPATASALAASLSLMGNTGASVLVDGDFFEFIVWNTAQINTQVYAYQHEVTGL